MAKLESLLVSSKSPIRNRVNFNNVQVFYFNRCQGFSCIPARGGSTVGMMARHSSFEEFHVDDYEVKRKYERYHLLLRKYYSGKVALTPALARKLENLVRGVHSLVSARCRIKPPGGLSWIAQVGTSQLPAENVPVEVGSPPKPVEGSHELDSFGIDDADFENEIASFLDCCILERLPIKKRKFLLQKSGVKQIDHSERVDCQAIRESREVCGCSCPDGVCLPDSCQCALNNVICQIDSVNFPCACSRAGGCANPQGRLEFNQRRVRVHYLHTKMRLFDESVADHQQSPPQAIGSGTGDDASGCLGNQEKRQRLDSSESEGVAGIFPEWNSNLKGSCVLCDDAEFVERCAKTFNIPVSGFPTSCPAHWQSPPAGPVQTDNGDQTSVLVMEESSADALTPFWPAGDSLAPAVDAGLAPLDPAPVYLITANADTIAPYSHSCLDPSACVQPLGVALSDGQTGSVPIHLEYSAYESAVSLDQTALAPPPPDTPVPLAPITSLLPKLLPELASVCEVRQPPCRAFPPPLAAAAADLGAQEVEQSLSGSAPPHCELTGLATVSVDGRPDHTNSGVITFSTVNEEVRA